MEAENWSISITSKLSKRNINTKWSCHKIGWKQQIQILTKFLASVWIEKQDLLSGVFLHRLRRQAAANPNSPSPPPCLSPSLLFPTVPGRMSVTSLLDIEAFVIRGPCQTWSRQIAMNVLNKPSHLIISSYLDLPMLNWTAYLFKSRKTSKAVRIGLLFSTLVLNPPLPGSVKHKKSFPKRWCGGHCLDWDMKL